MKRKAVSIADGSKAHGILKNRAKKKVKVVSEEELQKCFQHDVFTKETLEANVNKYAASNPYKHGVISSLIDDRLLRAVRDEIKENIHFTLKETDIYKIHQSGDLANLDGLDDATLEKLPNLLLLRDALYSSSFRNYIATITGSGNLSGQKTDMAINIYTPGCNLLCHDDVIGSRKVSYILYLTDPDIPWKEEWGGALRLFPTTVNNYDGMKTVTPSPYPQKILPPAWNQLSFFAVQPGKSFHDVEEVYHAANKKQLEKDGGRVRMAISGWYHIPQKGEEGYIDGEEEKWGENSSLKQLQGNTDRCDFPKPQPSKVEKFTEQEKEEGLNERELDFLLKYIAPNYLIPYTLESVAQQFTDSSCVTLEGMLSQKFSERLRKYIEDEERSSVCDASDQKNKCSFQVARPPHKQRFLYIQPEPASTLSIDEKSDNPVNELLSSLLPSKEFRKWLELATKCSIESSDTMVRRFRRGLDYSLATNYDDKPRLEISLGLTTTSGWVGDIGLSEEKENKLSSSDLKKYLKKYRKHLGKTRYLNSKNKDLRASISNEDMKRIIRKIKKSKSQELPSPQDMDVGGHEIYMAGDEDDYQDAAIYKHCLDTEDENVLFTIPASWNKLSIVLRDRGVLKFMKYVSRNAKGDRWDISGTFGVAVEDSNEDSENEDEDGDTKSLSEVSVSGDEDFNGFPDSDENSSS
ncbi:Prolyl 3,4-dihydroxylase TPA1 [Golovinomyces cichoracearum]|uniref:uS12 prolyl 3,4-dihydroxylase n=1 Tax=Golovinomyces cichoracearum TaxID=62708 RepID=A0A420J0A6_9PEZI|nr:Prolyl 3,4-dihydroxylase TPA1 [Golovinomyces cichoracearum]